MIKQERMLLATSASLNLGSGFLIQGYALYAIGIGRETDAFFAAQAFPMILVAVLVSALNNGLTPLFSSMEPQAASRLLTRLINIGMLASVFFMLICIGLNRPLIALAFSSFDKSTLQLTETLSLLAIGSALLQVNNALVASWMSSQGKFTEVEVVHSIFGVVAVGAVIPAVNYWGITAVSSVLAAKSLTTLVVLRLRLSNSASSSDNRDSLKSVGRRLWPLVWGGSIYKTGPAFTRIIAARSAPGDLSLIGYAEQVSSAVLTLVERVFTRPLLAGVGRTSRIVATELDPRQQYYEHLAMLTRPTIVFLTLLIFSSCIVLLLSGYEVITATTQRRSFIFLGLLLMIPVGAAGQFSAAYLYGRGRTGEVTQVATVSFSISVATRFAGQWLFGIWGLIIGIVLYQALNFALLAHRILKNGHR